MTTAYKLLAPNLTTHGSCQWVVGEWKETSGEGALCGPGWFHCYDSAEIAPFLNPIHANIHKPVLYRVEVGGDCKTDHGPKTGYTRMRLIEPVPFRTPTIAQCVRFGLYCAASVYHDPAWCRWAQEWVRGANRSVSAAEAATRGAAEPAMWAAVSASIAANGGKKAAAADAAVAAATAASLAAVAAAWAEFALDLQCAAQWAMSDEPWPAALTRTS